MLEINDLNKIPVDSVLSIEVITEGEKREKDILLLNSSIYGVSGANGVVVRLKEESTATN